MVRAAVFGVVASTALVIGAAIGQRFRLPERVLAMLLALAAGSLITALAFELFEHSFEQGGAWPAAIGFAGGAAAFTAISAWLDSHVRRRPAGTAGPALLAAVTLDGVPENLALGMLGESETGGVVLLVAIFLSNFPESLVGAASMRQQGHSARYVLGTWSAAAVLLALAVVLGAWLFGGSQGTEVSLPLAFAAGAVVASLADTLMPQAYEKGGAAVALATAAGFLISYLVTAF